jgi:subtilisin family serine protease
VSFSSLSRPVTFALWVSCVLCRSWASPPTPAYVEGEVIVTFKAPLDLPAARKVFDAHSLTLGRHFASLSQWRNRQTALARGGGRTTRELIDELRRDLAVETVEPNYLRWPDAQPPNDTLFPQLWGLNNAGQSVNGFAGTAGDDIKFLPAWSLARPSATNVVVAVIDTGVDYRHPDLAANMWTNPGEIPNNGVDDDGNGYVDDYYGYDFADGAGDPQDSGFHGTHVAGTIAAVGKNQLGVIGVDFLASIMALKASNNGNNLSDSAIIEAIQYATLMKHKGVNIAAINASFGGAGYDSAMASAIQSAGDAGIIFCAAAGNNTSDNDVTPFYPASYRLANMIVVAASDQNDALASFSDYGATTVDLSAPGVNILSTAPTNLAQITAYVKQFPTTYSANALTYSGTTTGLTATIYDCGLGYSTNFPAGVSGNVALIQRGTLLFSQKVSNAMAAGALAAIIYNNVSGNFLGTLGSGGNWIPAISLSQADGLALQATLPSTATVAAFVDPANFYQYLDGTSMATPHVTAAVAFAAMNFPSETVAQRIQRILGNVDSVAGLAGKVRTGGRLNLQRTVDTDGNGLPDWWEQLYFGHLTGTDPNADPDGDGFNNLQEYIADTNPTNSNSCLRILSTQVTSNGVSLTWSGGAQASQRPQWASSIGGINAWTSLVTNQPPTPLTNTYVDVLRTNGTGFYRIEAERP